MEQQDFDAMTKAVDDCQVVLNILITNLDRGQREIADRLKGLGTQIEAVENDLTIMKKCLAQMVRTHC